MLKSDEIWHYYDGSSPVDIHVIDQEGQLKMYTLGNPIREENASFQRVIKAGEWFAAEVRDKTAFALVGCTNSPGFEYNDFALAERNRLANQYPEYSALINRLCRVKSTATSELATSNSFGFYTSTKNNETCDSMTPSKKTSFEI